MSTDYIVDKQSGLPVAQAQAVPVGAPPSLPVAQATYAQPVMQQGMPVANAHPVQPMNVQAPPTAYNQTMSPLEQSIQCCCWKGKQAVSIAPWIAAGLTLLGMSQFAPGQPQGMVFGWGDIPEKATFYCTHLKAVCPDGRYACQTVSDCGRHGISNDACLTWLSRGPCCDRNFDCVCDALCGESTWPRRRALPLPRTAALRPRA